MNSFFSRLSHRSSLLLALALLAAGALIACGDDDDDGEPGGGAATTATTESESPTPAQSSDLSAAFRQLSFPGELTDGYFIGEADAPLQLVVFEDFQCPHCLRFTLVSEPEIVENWVLEGKLRLEFRNFPVLGDESALAAFASQCAAESDAFWELHKELFLAQFDAGQLEDQVVNAGRFSPDELVRHATAVGLDGDAFRTCLEDEATYEAVLEQVRGARELGLNSTPSFVLNGQPLARYPDGPESWSNFLESFLDE